MITREKSKKGELKLKLKVSGENWKKAVEEAYEKNKGKYNIQGFRKGKAPRKVIEKTYGDTVFYDDAFEEIVSKEYGEFLTNNKEIEPADYPHVTIDSMTDDGLEVSLTVMLMPEVELGPVELDVKKQKANVSEKEVNEEIDRFVESQARFEESDKPSENGDFLQIDFEGSVDGKVFEGGSAQDYRLELGSHTFIEGFEEQLVGVKAGEEKVVKVTFPEKYPAENLAGKPADFKVTVKKVEKKVLPELNDKLVSFATEFNSVEEYKKSVKQRLLDAKTQQNERKYENDLIEALVNKAQVDLPDVMIEHEKQHLIEDFSNRLMYQNIKLDDYLSYLGKSREEFDKEYFEEAKRALKTRLVLQKLIKDENIQISHEEFHEKLHEIAHAQNKTCEEVEKSLSEYEVSYIQNDILINKLIELLKTKNKQ